MFFIYSSLYPHKVYYIDKKGCKISFELFINDEIFIYYIERGGGGLIWGFMYNIFFSFKQSLFLFIKYLYDVWGEIYMVLMRKLKGQKEDVFRK